MKFLRFYNYILEQPTSLIKISYRTQNGQFYNSYPLTHILISVFKQTQAQTLAIINSIKNNVHNHMAKKDQSKIKSIVKNYNDYKTHKI